MFLDSIAPEGVGLSPITVWEILDGIGRLDPELVVRFRELDRTDKAAAAELIREHLSGRRSRDSRLDRCDPEDRPPDLPTCPECGGELSHYASHPEPGCGWFGESLVECAAYGDAGCDRFAIA